MKVYSFLNTVVLVNGFEITEWDEGDDAINIERRVDSAIDVMGNDGVMAVSLSADKSGVFSFRLQQTSSSNATFTALLNSQENGAFVPIFVQFKDTGGNDLASGTQGYIRKAAPAARGSGINGQLWEVVVERMDLVLGGTDTL